MLLHEKPRFVARARSNRRAVICMNQMVNARVTGTWQKDLARSTPMDAVSDLVGLSGLVKEGIKLLRGCEIAIDGASFRMGVFSVLPMVKINETYPLNGSEATNMRRDLRFGTCRGRLNLNEEGLPLLQLSWDAPYSGEGLDEFRLIGPNELHVVSYVTVNGRTVSYTSVHTRQR